MTFNAALQQLLPNQQLVAAFVFVGLDVVLAVLSVIYLGLKDSDGDGKNDGFKFGRLVDFLRDDVLAKVLPWAAIYVMATMYTGLDVFGISLSDIATGIWVGVLAALVASMATSLGDLGAPVGSIPLLGKTLTRP
jgi:hypothetical protein